jgi:hypothetical protein
MPAVRWTCDQEYRHRCWTTLFDLNQSLIEGRHHVSRSVVAIADSWALLQRPLETRAQLVALIVKYLSRLPWCPTCHKPMHLKGADADKAYPKLRHVIFVCDNCGRMSDQLVAVDGEPAPTLARGYKALTKDKATAYQAAAAALEHVEQQSAAIREQSW